MDKEKVELRKAEVAILDEFDRVCKANHLRYFLFYGTLLGAVRHKGFIPWDDDIDVAMPREDYQRLLGLKQSAFGRNFYLQIPCEADKWGGMFSKIRMKNTLFVIDKAVNPDKLLGGWKQYGIFIDVFPLDSSLDRFYGIKRIKDKLANAISAYIHYKVNEKEMSKHIALFGKVLHFFSIPTLIKIRDSIQSGRGSSYISYGGVYDVVHKTFPKEWFSTVSTANFEGREYPVPESFHEVLKTIYGEDYMELPPEEKRVNHQPVYLKINETIIDNRRNFNESTNS